MTLKIGSVFPPFDTKCYYILILPLTDPSFTLNSNLKNQKCMPIFKINLTENQIAIIIAKVT